METIRISEKNKITVIIRQIEKQIQTDQKNITYRKKNLRADDDFNLKQIQNYENKNIERKNEMEKMKQRISDIEKGKLDKDFENEQKENENNASKKQKLKIQKKRMIIEKKQKNKEKLHNYYDREKKFNRSVRATEREMKRGYYYYHKCVDSVPDYLKKKLKNMPNNKGYIWRGVHCYGEKKHNQKDPRQMYEKKKNKYITHERHKGYYKIWHKEDNKKKKMIHKEKIKKRDTSNSLLDYVLKE